MQILRPKDRGTDYVASELGPSDFPTVRDKRSAVHKPFSLWNSVGTSPSSDRWGVYHRCI